MLNIDRTIWLCANKLALACLKIIIKKLFTYRSYMYIYLDVCKRNKWC